jgi:predicted nucleic acid-binding Zn ribbon protein
VKRAADILKLILKQNEAARAREWSSFFNAWEAVAGEDIAAHSCVSDVKRGTMIVEVDHPGWLQLLQLKKSQILKDIQGRYPELEIRDMRSFVRSDAGDNNRAIESEPPNEPGGPVTASPDENSEEYREFKSLLDRLRSQIEEDSG